MPATIVKLGPGLLQIGATGTETDFTCQITAAHVDWEVDAEDAVTVLCGDSIPGDRTYAAVLAGTLYSDLGNPDGIVEYTWTHKGEQVPFKFVPSTTAGKQVTGTLIVDPLSVGGEEAGANMTSDFEWACVGTPTLGPAAAELSSEPSSEPEGVAV